MVEFSRGELIPARVMGSAFSADVALLQLERNPVNAVAAVLGDSNKVEVGIRYLWSALPTVLVAR